MPNSERAKQFAPFDALKGLQKALRLKEYEHDRSTKGDLDDETILKISEVLKNIKKNNQIYIKYFEKGYYKDGNFTVKNIDVNKKILSIEDKKINFDDIFDLKILDKID